MRTKSLQILSKFPKILRHSYFVEIESLGKAVEAVIFCGSENKCTKNELMIKHVNTLLN